MCGFKSRSSDLALRVLLEGPEGAILAEVVHADRHDRAALAVFPPAPGIWRARVDLACCQTRQGRGGFCQGELNVLVTLCHSALLDCLSSPGADFSRQIRHANGMPSSSSSSLGSSLSLSFPSRARLSSLSCRAFSCFCFLSHSLSSCQPAL